MVVSYCQVSNVFRSAFFNQGRRRNWVSNNMNSFKACLCLIVAHSAFCQVDEAFKAGDQQFSFGQVVDDEQDEPDLNASKHRKFLYDLEKNRHVAVYDKLITPDQLGLLHQFLTAAGHDAWQFNNYDADDVNAQATPDNIAWINNKDPLTLSKTSISRLLVNAIQDMSGDNSPLYPYKVQGKVIRRGDHTKVVSDSTEDGEYSALVYVNSEWKKNWYGETYFYDESREISCGVTPKAARIVTWDSSLLRLMRPPAITFNRGQILFHVIYSKSKEKMMKAHIDYKALQEDRKQAKDNWLLKDYQPKNPETFVPDVSKHLTMEYKTKLGHRILVFDDLFPEDMLINIRKHVLKYGRYFYDDSTNDPTSDNVQWIAGYSMPDYLTSPYWNITKKVAEFASGKKSMFPYDVAINLIRNADYTKIHKDCDNSENEWTFLVYLNPDWSRSKYGETVFFEENKRHADIVAEVLPKFGRAVIFQGRIPHSARPPSPNFTGARLSFATKLSPTEFIGRSKNFRQEFNHVSATASMLQGESEPEQKEESEDEEERSEEEQHPKLVRPLFERFLNVDNNPAEVAELYEEMEIQHKDLRKRAHEELLSAL